MTVPVVSSTFKPDQPAYIPTAVVGARNRPLVWATDAGTVKPACQLPRSPA